MPNKYMRTSPRRKQLFSCSLAALIAVLALLSAGASAASTPSIEGVWAFIGGEIAIQPEGGGKYDGIVESPTTFASCVHPVGQEIWSEITPQSDGSFWGLHQWYKDEGGNCSIIPTRGKAAYRVLETKTGSRYLLVCLSDPGSTSQPTIPAGSTKGVGATAGCTESLMTAPLASSAVGSFKSVVSLPSNKQCLSVRKFNIHIRNAKLDPFKTVSVTLNKRRVKAVLKGSVYVATVNLKGLPKGAFTVKIKATTFRGNHVAGSRTYHTCIPGKKKSKKK